jgi:hypothetical protein
MKHKNKIAIIALLALSFSASTFQSCKKYENGPTLSLRSRTQRVSNVWKIENYTLDGVDLTNQVKGYTETFDTDKNYSYSWGLLSGKGKWDFQNDDKEVKVYGIDGQTSRVLTILKLEEKSFWYKSVNNGQTAVMHLIPN